MNILELISSVSRIAIAAFVITLAVVAYEVYLLVQKRNKETKSEKDIKLPEFNDSAQGQSFTPLNVAEAVAKPVQTQSRKISKRFLPILLGLLVLIVLFSGYLIYRRNQVSSVKVDVANLTPTAQPVADGMGSGDGQDSVDGGLGEGTSGDGQGGIIVSPTSSPIPTTSVAETDDTLVTDEEDKGDEPVADESADDLLIVTSTPAVSEDVMPTGSVSISPEVSSTPIPTALPEAGVYQSTLIISIVALAVIYLALIL